MNIISESLTTIYSLLATVVATYAPKVIAGCLILFIGVIVASLLKDLVRLVFTYFKIDKWLGATGVVKETDIHIWPNLIAELVRWLTIFIFLTSAVETWGVPKVGEVLNQLTLFLPSVFVSVIIGWIGLISARFSFDIVRHSLKGVGGSEAIILGNIAKYAILFFTALIILTQLGVAADLVKILFTGIVAMLALAFGLAFGLGGQEEAKNILKNLRKKLGK